MNYSIKQLEELKKAGKIRDFTVPEGYDRKTPKKSKYGNVKTEVDGIVFASAKEAARYVQLRYLLNAKLISDLELQVEFELNEGGTHSLIYRCDFCYMENGELVVEDVKSPFTAKMATYKKKKRLMWEQHGIKIKEV